MDWLNKINTAEKTALIQEGNKKIHYKFENGEEMAEEYNMETNILVRRAWKRGGGGLVKTGKWDIEVGDPDPTVVTTDIGIRENINSPYIIKRNTKTSIEWRIRNLPYPVETYSVTAEPENKCIVVRTTNKKYFKKIPVEELDRVNLLPEQRNINFSHKFNTLIITVSQSSLHNQEPYKYYINGNSLNFNENVISSLHVGYHYGHYSLIFDISLLYKKPPQVLEMEQKVLFILKSVQTINDGDLPCKPS